MTGGKSPRLTMVIVLVVLLASQAVAVEREDLLPLPLPNLSTMEDATRQRLELLQTRVTDLQLSGSDGDLAEAYGTLGTYYIAHHLNDAAEIAFRNAALLSPGDYRWPYYLGFIYQLTGNLDGERASFERALELRPDDIPAHLHLAEVLLSLGDNEAAYNEFRRVLELSPSEAAALGGLGRAAAALGRPEEAVEYLTKALELQPRATIVHYQLALAYRKLGDMDTAMAHMEKRGTTEIGFADPLLGAIEPLKNENVVEVVIEMAAEPEDHDDRSVAVFAASYLKNLPEAVEQIHEAIVNLTPAAGALDPASEEAARNRLIRARLHFALASLRLDRGDYGGAQNQVEVALTLVPDMAEAILMLGGIFEITGDLTAAVERYSAVLELEPSNGDALRSRARTRMALHDDREAITDLERLCDLGLEGDGVRIRLAVAHLRLGELEAARENYQKALDLNLGSWDAARVHHHLGIIEARTGSVESAVEEYNIALELDPDLVAARLDLGVALGRLGRHQESLETFQHIIETDPENVRARLGEAEALTALGRTREALELLEQSSRAHPENVELTHALARLLASADDPELRDGERALDLARQAVRAGLSPGRLETLAMASAEAGVFDAAVRLQQELIQRLTIEGHVESIPRLEANLARYRAGLTCCAPTPRTGD